MEEVIEMFGKRLKIVTDEDDNARICNECAVKAYLFVEMQILRHIGILKR